MWSLCVPLLCVLQPLGQGESPGEQREIIVARLGSSITLHMRHAVTIHHQDTRTCDEFDWRYRGVALWPQYNASHRLARSKFCNLTIEDNAPFHNYDVSKDGNLTLYNVTRENALHYMVTVTIRSTGKSITDYYTLHVQVPLSQAAANVSCLPDGSTEASCWVEEGSDPDYSWSLNGGSVQGRSISGYSQISLPRPVLGNLRCTVRNNVSDTSTSVLISCPVPLSQAVTNVSCLPDGSAEASCWVEEGSDPDYSWSLDGGSVQGRSLSGYSQISLPPPVLGNLSCTVRNNVSDTSTSIIISCPVPLSAPLLYVSCHQNGSTEVTCSAQTGTDPSFYLTVNGELLRDNHTSLQRHVTVTVPSPGPWNVTCSVRNSINNSSTNIPDMTCAVPRSVPVINTSCQPDGSARVSCIVEDGMNGMNASYRWTVSENSYHGNNTDITLSAKHFIPGAITVSCSVNNSVSEESSNQTEIFCPGSKCFSCLEKSVMWGTVVLIVTTAPLIIAIFYTVYSTNQSP